MKRCMGCMELYEDQYDVCPHCGYEEDFDDHQLLHIDAGQILVDRYIVGRSLGFGGFGVTYIGWDKKLERKVAIKEYLPSEFATRMIHHQEIMVDSNEKKNSQFNSGMSRFLKEGEKLAQVGDVDGIVHMYDSFEANNTAYITMEYLKGMTLSEYLKDKGMMNENKVMDLMIPIFKALETVHEKGIIHRDIAPDNLFVTFDENGNEKLKLIDFGASKFASTSHSKSLTVMIKPGYSPEEQYRSNGDQGTYTDVYALAAVMYKMVTGIQLPDSFERRTAIESHKKDPLVEPDKCNKSLSGNFVIALLNALNVRIEDRTKTISEFENELVSFEPVKRRGSSIRKVDFLRWPIWAKVGVPVASLLAISLVIFAITKVFSGAATKFTLKEGYTRVPDFIMADFETEAQEMASVRKLNINSDGGVVFSPVAANGVVLAQDQQAGSIVNEYTVISLTLSTGEEEYVMPDVRGMRLEDAQKALEVMNVDVNIQEGTQDGLILGGVIDQDIEAYDNDNKVKYGSTVTLTVNTVKSASLNTVLASSIDKNYVDNGTDSADLDMDIPNINNMAYENALEKVYSAGWCLVVKSRIAGKGVAEGTILSQKVSEYPGDENVIEITVAMPDREFDLPNLAYKDTETAIRLLNNLGIEAEVEEESNEIVSKGLVIAQSISNKSAVKAGDKVLLTISKGGVPFKMPDFTTMNEEEAKKLASEKNLVLGTPEQVYDKDLPEGTVISQSIDVNTDVTRGTRVTIKVSTQNRENITTVPNVAGMTLNAAKKVLSDSELEYVINEEWSSTAKNSIVRQEPEAGIDVAKKMVVILTVSKGERSFHWSEWSTDTLNATTEIETKTQYRVRKRETTESREASLSGWNQIGSRQEYGDYGAWSGWSETPESGSDIKEVKTQTVTWYSYRDNSPTSREVDDESRPIYKTYYQYQRCWTVDGQHAGPDPGSISYWGLATTPIEYTGWLESPIPYDHATDVGISCYGSWGDPWYNEQTRSELVGYEKKTVYEDNWSNWSGWSTDPVSGSSTREVQTQEKTEYQYRMRETYNIYNYERWTDWSAWSDNPQSGDDRESRVMYRYKIYDE